MKFEKTITINLGNFESLKIGVGDCKSFEECDNAIICEIKRLELNEKVDCHIKESLGL